MLFMPRPCTACRSKSEFVASAPRLRITFSSIPFAASRRIVTSPYSSLTVTTRTPKKAELWTVSEIASVLVTFTVPFAPIHQASRIPIKSNISCFVKSFTSATGRFE
jgi:hypothetical protein